MLCFGKHPPKHDYRTLRFKDYLLPTLPPPPPAVSNLARVYGKLGISDPKLLFPMDGNDQYGDCTIAGMAHAITMFRGFLGQKLIPSAAAVTKLYFRLTGGIDSGANELDILNFWRKSKPYGPLGDQDILAHVSVDAHNHTHVQQALSIFGSLYIGFQVQQNAGTDFHARRIWRPGKLTNSGHAVVATDYDSDKLTLLTWGDTQEGTWDWWDECVDEAHCILPAEALQPGFAPGFDFHQLKADLAAVAN